MLVSKSRRALLRGMTIAPVTASVITSPWAKALASLHQRYDDEPAIIVRTKGGGASAAAAITMRNGAGR